jgi:predicted nucleotidyltransferase
MKYEQSEVLELLKKYVLLLNKEGYSIVDAILYGSYSNNTANEFSDIDIMLISEKYDINDDYAVGNAWRLTKQISTKIEPYIIAKSRFMDDNISPFISNIKSTGVSINFS